MSLCESCLVRSHASSESKDNLIAYYIRTIDRLTGGRADELDLPVSTQEPQRKKCEGSVPKDALAALEQALWDPSVFRKPPRVAAPKLVALLEHAGFRLTKGAET